VNQVDHRDRQIVNVEGDLKSDCVGLWQPRIAQLLVLKVEQLIPLRLKRATAQAGLKLLQPQHIVVMFYEWLAVVRNELFVESRAK
jgi:hypothetical protein